MESNKSVEFESLNNEKNNKCSGGGGTAGFTYVFDEKEEMSVKKQQPLSKLRRKVWQVFPTVCGSMMCIPFGLMLGWPSPTYPSLILSSSTIPISLDQSAMVAGFLMIGNSLSTPLSSTDRIGAKYGLILGVAVMVIGWITMWQALDIFWLLASRLMVGLGHGFGLGQLKIYISEICQQNLAQHLIKQINFYAFFGVTTIFSIGPFVDFRQLGIICTIISIFVLFLSIFLPSTPKELIRNEKLIEAKKLLTFLNPEVVVFEEVARIRIELNAENEEMSFVELVKNEKLRKKFVLFVFLVFFQQFSGAPATIIYSQILFSASGCFYPEFCAILYSIIFFLANILGVFYVCPRFTKRYSLLFSSIAVSSVIILKIIVLVERINETFWGYTSLVVMGLFIVVHTAGLGTVPFSLIPDLFPKSARNVVVHFFIIFHSILALVITKIFQVLYGQVGLYAPFCLFFTISAFAIIFILIFVPKELKFNGK